MSVSTDVSVLMLEGRTSLSIDKVKAEIISSLRERGKIVLQESLK